MEHIPEHILIVQIGKLGDMILTTPLFKAIKEIFPSSKITVIASERNYQIAETDTNIEKVLIYPVNFAKRISFFVNLKFQRIDLWIDTKNNFSKTSKLLAEINKPVRSLGFNFETKVYDTSLRDFVKGEHSTDINLSAAEYLKKQNDKASLSFKSKPVINIPPTAEKKVQEYLKRFNKKIVIFNISAGDKIRYWHNEKWAELLKLTEGNNEMEAIILSTEEDKEKAEYIKGKNKSKAETAVMPLFEMAALIKHSDGVVSPDTSVIHIASAFDKPVIGLYGNTEWNKKKFAPLSSKHKLLTSNDANSLNSIEAKEVYDSLRELL